MPHLSFASKLYSGTKLVSFCLTLPLGLCRSRQGACMGGRRLPVENVLLRVRAAKGKEEEGLRCGVRVST